MSCLHCTIVGCCRKIGPEMPSAELLAAAAKLTEAEAELRYFLEKRFITQALIIQDRWTICISYFHFKIKNFIATYNCEYDCLIIGKSN